MKPEASGPTRGGISFKIDIEKAEAEARGRKAAKLFNDLSKRIETLQKAVTATKEYHSLEIDKESFILKDQNEYQSTFKELDHLNEKLQEQLNESNAYRKLLTKERTLKEYEEDQK